AARGAPLSGRIGDVPGGQEVVRLVAASGEVVVDVDRVVAGLEALHREPERDDAPFPVTAVVPVEVAVLPGAIGAPPLIEVDRGSGPDERRRGQPKADEPRSDDEARPEPVAPR